MMKGQTLIELLVGLTLVSLILGAVTVSVTGALNNAQFSKQQNLATNYAQEGIEIIRKIRNTDYAEFRSYSGLYCLGEGEGALGVAAVSCDLNIDDTYIRSITIEPTSDCGVSGSRVTVAVAWTDGRCETDSYCHQSELVSCLSTTNPIEEP